MIVSINPTYYCNFRCNFCYLTEQQLSDRHTLNLEILQARLSEILAVTSIDMVDIYGGEVGLLKEDYWNNLIDLLHFHGVVDINLITNLSMVNNITNDPRVYTSVSFDFEAREEYQRVWRNLALLNKPYSILMLASPSLMEKPVSEMANMLNTLSNLESVEIKPYSKNQANQLNINFTDYEQFVKQWINYPNKKFKLINETLLQSVLDRSRNSFSDDHLYITPTGSYGVLEFDLNDNEYFLEYSTLEQYYQWCVREKKRVSKNKFCSSCDYHGHCLSEHLREVKTIDDSCNGFRNLIMWYENGRMENSARNISPHLSVV